MWLCVEEHVADGELAVRTEFPQSLAVLIRSANAEVPNAVRS